MPFLLIVVVSALAHLWCLGSVFFLDDIPQIRDNPHVRDGTWWEVSPFLRWTYFWYWVQAKLWGTSPVGFHLVNWLLHTACGVAVFLFGREVLKKNGVALCGALLFVAHPLGSEIPNYARTQDLAWVTLFSVLAAWFAVRLLQEFRWWLVGAMVMCMAGATFSKGPGLFHALMMLGFAVLACAGKESWRVMWRWSWLAVLMVVGVWLSGGLDRWVGGMSRWGTDEFRWHAVTLCRVFWKFMGLFFYPKNLSADHFIAGTMSWEDEEAMSAVVGFVLWIVVATGLMIRRRTRLVGMCLWLFVGTILFRMAYLINEFMPEYRIYPGLPWMCLAVAVTGAALLKKAGKVSVVVLIALLCVISAKRSFQWHSLEALCEDVLRQYPENGRALWMLQRRDADAGNWEAVVERFPRFEQEIEKAFLEESARIHPGRAFSGGHQNLAQVANFGYYAEALAALGRGREAMQLMQQVGSYVKRPGIPKQNARLMQNVYHHALGRVHEQMGEYARALEVLGEITGKDYREVDRERIRRKLGEESGKPLPRG